MELSANAIVQYLGSCGFIVVGLRAAYRTNFTAARLRSLAIIFFILALSNVGFGSYLTFAEARTPQNILMIVTGVNWAAASGAFFYASSRKRRMTSGIKATA